MYQYSNRRNKMSVRKKYSLAVFIGLLPFLFFAIIGYFDWTNITQWDYEVGSFFYDLRTPTRNMIMTGITRLADREMQTAVTVIAVLLFLLFKKWRTGLWYGLTVLLGAEVLNGLVKNFYGRIRPEQIEHVIEQGGYAFPSGHAMGAMIIYGGLFFIFVQYSNSKTWQWLLGIISVILILMIGLSRIYLGVHYPSDVIGGFSLGFSWLCLAIVVYGLQATQYDFKQPRYSFKKF